MGPDASRIACADPHGRLPHAPVRGSDPQLAMGMIERISLVLHKRPRRPDFVPEKSMYSMSFDFMFIFRLSHNVFPSDFFSPSCLAMTSRNFYSNADPTRRLLGGLADVDKLGLDRRSTDEEPIDIGLLGYKSGIYQVEVKQQEQKKYDQPCILASGGTRRKKTGAD